jgi:hypothetical protein
MSKKPVIASADTSGIEMQKRSVADLWSAMDWKMAASLIRIVESNQWE